MHSLIFQLDTVKQEQEDEEEKEEEKEEEQEEEQEDSEGTMSERSVIEEGERSLIRLSFLNAERLRKLPSQFS